MNDQTPFRIHSRNMHPSRIISFGNRRPIDGAERLTDFAYSCPSMKPLNISRRLAFKRLCVRFVWGSVVIPVFQHSGMNVDRLIERNLHVPRYYHVRLPWLNLVAPGPRGGSQTRRQTARHCLGRNACQSALVRKQGASCHEEASSASSRKVRSVRDKVCAKQLIDGARPH